MSACAGSLTKAMFIRQEMNRLVLVWPCVARKVPARRSNILKHFAGQVVQTAPGRIEFMSTQRQEGRLRPARSMIRASKLTPVQSASLARFTYEQQSGLTAPPNRDRLATNSLLSDCLTTQLVRYCSGSYPPGPAAARQPSGRRFSGHPFRPSPPLPQLRVSVRPCRVYPRP
jgi:hypothetical protein